MCILLTASEFNFLQYPSFDNDSETSAYRFVSCLGWLLFDTEETCHSPNYDRAPSNLKQLIRFL